MARMFERPKKFVARAGKDVHRAAVEAKDIVGDKAEVFVEKAGEGAVVIADKAGDAKLAFDRARFNPVFSMRDIEDNMPMLIHIDDNQKVKGSKACERAIGFLKDMKGMKVFGLFPESMERNEIRFHPDKNGVLYYRDPYDDHLYINLEDYFGYMNEVRVNELKNVAHALGAKHVKIEYKEEKKSLVSKQANVAHGVKVGGRGKGGPNRDVNVGHQASKNEYTNIEVLAEVNYEGSTSPTAPSLTYLQNDSMTVSLIERRMDPERGGQFVAEHYQIRCKNLKGLKKNDAVRIDGVLKKLKLNGNTSVVSECESEGRAVLDFTIEF